MLGKGVESLSPVSGLRNRIHEGLDANKLDLSQLLTTAQAGAA